MPIKRPQVNRAAKLAMTTALVTALAGCDGRIGRGIDGLIGPIGSNEMPGSATAKAPVPTIVAPGNPTYQSATRAQDLQQFEQIYGPPIGSEVVTAAPAPNYSVPAYNDGALQSSALSAPSYGPLPASTPTYQTTTTAPLVTSQPVYEAATSSTSYGVIVPAPYQIDAGQSVATVAQSYDTFPSAPMMDTDVLSGQAATESVTYSTEYTAAPMPAYTEPMMMNEPVSVIGASAVELEYSIEAPSGSVYGVIPDFGTMTPPAEPMPEMVPDTTLFQQGAALEALPMQDASASVAEVEISYGPAPVAEPFGVLAYGAAFGEDVVEPAPGIVEMSLAELFGTEVARNDVEAVPMVEIGEPRQKPVRNVAGGQFVIADNVMEMAALQNVEIAPSYAVVSVAPAVSSDAPAAAPSPYRRPDYAVTNHRVASYSGAPRRRPASLDRIIVAAGAKIDLPADSAKPAAVEMIDIGALPMDGVAIETAMSAEVAPVVEMPKAEIEAVESAPAIIAATAAEIVTEELAPMQAAAEAEAEQVEVIVASPSLTAPKIPALDFSEPEEKLEAPKAVTEMAPASGEATNEEVVAEMAAAEADAMKVAETTEAESMVKMANAPDLAPVTQQRPRSAPAVTSKLSGTSWRLVEIGGAQVSEKAELHFDGSSGFAGGQGPCNSYGGEYKNDEPGMFKMSSIFATELPCEARDLEAAYIEMLESAKTYEVAPRLESMTLIGANGNVVAKFEAF